MYTTNIIMLLKMMLRVIEFDFWNQNLNKFNLIYIVKKKKKKLTVTFNLENNQSIHFVSISQSHKSWDIISKPQYQNLLFMGYHLVVS
jgi:hypothetical protein